MVCIQVIGNDRGKIDIHKLVVISKHDKFVIAGKRLMVYDLDQNTAVKDMYFNCKPISVEFNSYYMQIVVLTSFDIRIYDCITGRLKRIINSLNNFNSDAELTALVFDSRNRVFAIGNSHGCINAYNFANGSYICAVKEPSKGNNKGSNIFIDENNSEISALFYCIEDKILIASS